MPFSIVNILFKSVNHCGLSTIRKVSEYITFIREIRLPCRSLGVGWWLTFLILLQKFHPIFHTLSGFTG